MLWVRKVVRRQCNKTERRPIEARKSGARKWLAPNDSEKAPYLSGPPQTS